MNKSIPITRSSLPPIEEYYDEIKELWDSRWLTNMGSKHNLLIDELKKYFNVDNLDLVVNGHNALEIAIESLNLKGEIITTPFTFVSTINAIVNKGLTPVFCDINPDDYTIDTNKIEKLITNKTCAIMPVHVYGNICNVEEIEKIAKKHHLKVIYDAAHAFGETYKNKSVLSYGDISCLSFHATKVFHTIEGGCIVFKDSNLIQRIYQLKDFGIKDEETIDIVGTNAKMNEFCAAMGLCNLRHIDENINKRKIIFERYINNLQSVKNIKLPKIQKDVESNYSYFPIFVDKMSKISRDTLKQELENYNIYTRKYFYPIINNTDAYKKYNNNDTPIAKDLSNRVLTLPIYSDLTIEEIDYICKSIKNIINDN